MPIVSGSIPKLTDGVSQQAVTLRLNTAVADQKNAWLSVVTGNQKRPPSKIIKKVGSIETGNVATTVIDRFDGKKFIVVIKSGSVRVFDAATGNEKTVNTPDGLTYLNSASETDYDFVTVADTTFICNKKKIITSVPIAEDPERLNSELYWSIFVKEAIPNANYAVYINNTLEANFTTKSNIDSANIMERTSVIAENLRADLASAGAVGEVLQATAPTGFVGTAVSKAHDSRLYNASGGSGTGCKIRVKEERGVISSWHVAEGGSGYTVSDVLTISGTYLPSTSFTVTDVTLSSTRDVTRNNSTVTLRLRPDDKVGLDDGNGGDSMTVFGEDIVNFSKLPPQDREYRIVKVKGDAGDQGDDYYVMYKDTLWRETWGYGTKLQLVDTTMPHVLVYDPDDDTFTFKKHVWKERVVGDEDTNPVPSFVGQSISAMTLYRGRLVLLSGENVIMSESDNYENFFRSTVIQLLDSEPIDIAAVTGRQANLFHPVQWNKKLLIFSDKSQFVLDTGQVLSPKTAAMTAASAYDCSQTVRPISMDSSVYFVEDSGTYAKLYQYMVGQDSLTEQADLSSIQVPEYIQGPVKRMVGIPKASAIFIQGADPKKLYVYKFMDSPQGKIQSAWNTWEFTRDIKAMNVSGTTLYVLTNGSDGLYLSSITIEDDAVRDAYDLTVYLDDQIALSTTTRVYDPLTKTTTITLPYAYDMLKLKMVCIDETDMLGYAPVDVLGYVPPIQSISPTQYVVDGDWTGFTGVVGHSYEYLMTFSPFILREAKANATAAIQDGILSIRYLSLNYEDTAYFRVSVKTRGSARDTHPGSAPSIYTFNGLEFGHQTTTAGAVPLASGEFKFPVFEDGRYAEVTVTNDSPFHSCFSSAEWYGQWTPKAKQRF